MVKSTTSSDLARLINQLQAERQQHADAGLPPKTSPC